MISIDGNVEFCSACTAAGEYLGSVQDPRVEEDSIFVDVSHIFGQSSDGRRTFIALQDQDSGWSRPLEYLSETEAALKGAELEPGQEGELFRITEQAIYRRIGDCKAGTICKPTECPAFNTEILNTIIQKTIQDL